MGDVGPLHRLWRDPEVRRFLWDGEEIPRGRAEAAVRKAVEDFGRRGFGLWIAERRGLATEISVATLRYGFEMAGITRVRGLTDAGNVASRRVLEKLGMAFEGYVVEKGREQARYAIGPEDLRPAPPTRQDRAPEDRDGPP